LQDEINQKLILNIYLFTENIFLRRGQTTDNYAEAKNKSELFSGHFGCCIFGFERVVVTFVLYIADKWL